MTDQPDPAFHADKTPAIAEVRLPGFTFASGPGKVAVSIRIVKGRFTVGPAQLRFPDGHMRSVKFLGVVFVSPDFSSPGAMECWTARRQAGLVEVTLDGVIDMDLLEGLQLI